MNYEQFRETYCQDIISNAAKSKADFHKLESIFTYDDIVRDDEGNYVKIIRTPSGREIPVYDIITAPSLQEFLMVYPGEECELEYKNYMDMFVVLSSEELQNQIKLLLDEQRAKNEQYKSTSVSDILAWD